MICRIKPVLIFAFTLALSSASMPETWSAENLRLRAGISYVHDLDRGFPIIAEKVEDLKIESDKVTMIFFGAAGDLNTNRQARRLVDLYKKYKEHVKFLVIDVDHPVNAEAKQLIKNYYQGYIPQQVIVDKAGKTFWTHVGESDAAGPNLDKCLQ